MTLTEIIKKLQGGDISSAELVDIYLGRIKEKDNDISSFLSINEKNAKMQAKHADEQMDVKNSNPLHGIPYALKDNILARDLPATAG
ncbi:MAG: amidase family protein, partial [Candidatus Spechtbacterales bacterium]|nr:amidase family protein [Candidatus Spechtbacterales bacterium]